MHHTFPLEKGEEIVVQVRKFERTFRVHETWTDGDSREEVAELLPDGPWRKRPRRITRKTKRERL